MPFSNLLSYKLYKKGILLVYISCAHREKIIIFLQRKDLTNTKISQNPLQIESKINYFSVIKLYEIRMDILKNVIK
jgi:hypothetical protein